MLKYSQHSWGFLLALLFFMCVSGLRPQATQAMPSGALVSHEIRYRAPDAGEVALVWGVNGWQQLPATSRPAGTTLIITNREVMRTPMRFQDGVFHVTVDVPAGSVVNFAFEITRTRSGVGTDVWDLNGAGEPGFTSNPTAASTEIQQTISMGSRIFATSADDTLQLQVLGVVMAITVMLGMIAMRKVRRNPYLDF